MTAYIKQYDPRCLDSKSILLPKGDTCTFTNTEDYKHLYNELKERESGNIVTCSGTTVYFIDVTTMSDKQPVYQAVYPPANPWERILRERHKTAYAKNQGEYADEIRKIFQPQEDPDYKAACEELGLSATETALKLALEEQTKYDSGKDRRNAGKKNHNIFYYLYRIFTFHRSPRET